MFATAVRDELPHGVTFNIVHCGNNDINQIVNGVVVDVDRRAAWAFTQVTYLLAELAQNKITNDSVIYFEDFWHPGAEQFAYACAIKGVRPKVYAYCWAQSADPHDFTAKLMMPWIRHIERGWASWLTGVFVAAPELRDMLVVADIVAKEKIHVVGLPYRRQTLVDNFYTGAPGAYDQVRNKTVVFASRLDKEKNPDFFCTLAKRFLPDSNIKFVFASGRQIDRAWKKSENIQIRANLSKVQYLQLLSESAVLFNCADQDFVSFALLDGLAYGCQPLCPDYLTFPDVLNNDQRYLYEHGSLDSAEKKLRALLTPSFMCQKAGMLPPHVWEKFGAKYELTVARMMQVMLQEPSLESYFKKRDN